MAADVLVLTTNQVIRNHSADLPNARNHITPHKHHFRVINSLILGRSCLNEQYLQIFLWCCIQMNATEPYWSTLVQVMAQCHQAASHYMSQCWSRSMSPYGHELMPTKQIFKWITQIDRNIFISMQRLLNKPLHTIFSTTWAKGAKWVHFIGTSKQALTERPLVNSLYAEYYFEET